MGRHAIRTHRPRKTLPEVLDGTVEPGRVFDRTISLDNVPGSHWASADREALKVLVQP